MAGGKGKKALGPTDVLFPVPAALVACGTVEESNIITVAWIGMMASNPPVLAISLRKNRHSLSIIKNTGEFSVNIPSASQMRETDYCGLVSGRKQNKAEDCEFNLVRGIAVTAPVILDCPFNLECKMVRETSFGKWDVLFGEVVETLVDADKVDPETGKPSVEMIDPLVYCATVREYWKLGEKLGKGFQAGKGLV